MSSLPLLLIFGQYFDVSTFGVSIILIVDLWPCDVSAFSSTFIVSLDGEFLVHTINDTFRTEVTALCSVIGQFSNPLHTDKNAIKQSGKENVFTCSCTESTRLSVQLETEIKTELQQLEQKC